MEAVLTSSQEKEVNNNERVKEGETAACDLAVSPRTVTVTDPEEWICVAKLPPDTDHQAFLHLLSDFGSVKDSFLQKSTKTGESFSPSVLQSFNCDCWPTLSARQRNIQQSVSPASPPPAQ